MTDQITISEQELELLKKTAVLEAKVGDMEEIIPELFSSLKSLTATVGNIPLEIVRCRDAMDKDLKAYSHDKFITDMELRQFEVDIETRVSKQLQQIESRVNRATWLISGFIAAGTFMNYLISNNVVGV